MNVHPTQKTSFVLVLGLKARYGKLGTHPLAALALEMCVGPFDTEADCDRWHKEFLTAYGPPQPGRKIQRVITEIEPVLKRQAEDLCSIHPALDAQEVAAELESYMLRAFEHIKESQ